MSDSLSTDLSLTEQLRTLRARLDELNTNPPSESSPLRKALEDEILEIEELQARL